MAAMKKTDYLLFFFDICSDSRPETRQTPDLVLRRRLTQASLESFNLQPPGQHHQLRALLLHGCLEFSHLIGRSALVLSHSLIGHMFSMYEPFATFVLVHALT